VDARLTSVLVMFIMLSRPDRAVAHGRGSGARRRAAAVLTLVGAVNLPIIKFSVRLVEHAASAGVGVPARRATIHASILVPLFAMAIAFTLLFRDAAYRGHAQRDPAPPGAQHAPDAGARAGRVSMDFGAACRLHHRRLCGGGRWWSWGSSPGWFSICGRRSACSAISRRMA